MVGFASMEIHNCSFYDGYAKEGGIIKVGNSSVNFSCCRFRENKANLTGGVLRLDQISKLYAHGYLFIENQVYAGGVNFKWK